MVACALALLPAQWPAAPGALDGLLMASPLTPAGVARRSLIPPS